MMQWLFNSQLQTSFGAKMLRTMVCILLLAFLYQAWLLLHIAWFIFLILLQLHICKTVLLKSPTAHREAETAKAHRG